MGEVDGTVAYLEEKGETATSLFASTLLNYILGLVCILVVHLCVLYFLGRYYPDVEVPKLLRFPRLECMFIFSTMQGLVLSAVTGIKMSCEASVKGMGTTVLIGHLALAIVLAVYIRTRIGSVAKFEYYQGSEIRAELVKSVSSHLRQLVVLPARSSAASAGKDEQEASAKSSAGSPRRMKVQPSKVREAFQAYKQTKEELSSKGIDEKVLKSKGKWVFANEDDSSAATTEKESPRASVPSDKGDAPEGTVEAARAMAAAARFEKRFGFFFEDYTGTCWWFGLVVIAAKFLTAIITPAFGAGSGAAQPFLLFLVEAIHLVILIRFMPFVSYADNFHNIFTKMSHVLTYFTFLGAALSMITNHADNVASYVSGAAGFAAFLQVIGALHLIFVQGYVIFEKLPPGFGKSVRDLVTRILSRRSKTAEADEAAPRKAPRKQSIREIKGLAQMLKSEKGQRSDDLHGEKPPPKVEQI